MLWDELCEMGVIQDADEIEEQKTYKEINIVMDNCGGQNKNRFVLRLLHVLVMYKICSIARIIFLIKGHTKNPCDRSFNHMKKEARKRNVYTPTDLIDALNQSRYIMASWFPEDGFRDWGAWADQFMKPTVKDVKKYHVFTVTNEDPTVMLKQASVSGPVVEETIVTGQLPAEVRPNPKMIEPKEIADIKWVELYDKWGKLVPPAKKKEWKYFNEDPGPVRRGKVKAERNKAKALRSQRSATKMAEASAEKSNKDKE